MGCYILTHTDQSVSFYVRSRRRVLLPHFSFNFGFISRYSCSVKSYGEAHFPHLAPELPINQSVTSHISQ